jgi:hypothetical protein
MMAFWRNQCMAIKGRVAVQKGDGHIIFINNVMGIVWIVANDLADEAGAILYSGMVTLGIWLKSCEHRILQDYLCS